MSVFQIWIASSASAKQSRNSGKNRDPVRNDHALMDQAPERASEGIDPMKRLAIAAMVALVAVPAIAQQREPLTSRSEAQKRVDAETDAAFKRTLKAIGNKEKAAPADPWGKVRSSTTGDKR